MLKLLLQLLCGVKKGNPCCQYSTIISTRGNEIFSISPAAALRTQISILTVKVSLSGVQGSVWTAVRRGAAQDISARRPSGTAAPSNITCVRDMAVVFPRARHYSQYLVF